MKLNNISILVVDDEPAIREVLRTCFELAGARVFEAESGKKALAFLKSQTVDVLLSDYQMADGDGFFLLKSIRNEIQMTPTIFIFTGNTDVKPEEFEILGAAAVFEKPFSAEFLISSISNRVRGNRPSSEAVQ